MINEYKIIEFRDATAFTNTVNFLAKEGWVIIESTIEMVYNHGKHEGFELGWSYSCMMKKGE